jgi:hypothetical protein
MTGKNSRSDFRLTAARYQVDRLTPADGGAGNSPAHADGPDDAGQKSDNAGQPRMEQRAQYVEVVIQQAIRRGDFDNLPGAGQPLRTLHSVNDPDWWIRQKIEREKITGLGPPALTLRAESAQLEGRLDRAGSEKAVRELLDDFNSRVIEARRQLQGGPPVVTPLRDVDEEIAGWRERRALRQQVVEREREREAAARAALSPRERREERRELRRRAKRADRR